MPSTKSFTPRDLLEVGEYLLDEEDSSCPNLQDFERDWIALREARVRTAICRAYYALFLELKIRLVGHRVEWRSHTVPFPDAGVHKLLRWSLETQLASNHVLLAGYKFLLTRRAWADYELPGAGRSFDIPLAQDCLDTAEEAFSKGLPLLGEKDFSGIASALFNEAAKKREGEGR